MTGGNIHNIALNAAFLAADAREPVAMAHILQAAHLEASRPTAPSPRWRSGGGYEQDHNIAKRRSAD